MNDDTTQDPNAQAPVADENDAVEETNMGDAPMVGQAPMASDPVSTPPATADAGEVTEEVADPAADMGTPAAAEATTEPVTTEQGEEEPAA
jgi:hypothetical protein